MPLPWKIGEFIVKHITHLDELENHLQKICLKEAKFVPGFDPDDKFMVHMELFGRQSFFTKIEQFQEVEGDNLNSLKIEADQVLEDIIRTNEGYMEHGREVVDKKPNSPTISVVLCCH